MVSTQLLAGEAWREGAILTNISNRPVYLGLGAAAALNTGIRLAPQGGVYRIDRENFSYGAVNAICAVLVEDAVMVCESDTRLTSVVF